MCRTSGQEILPQEIKVVSIARGSGYVRLCNIPWIVYRTVILDTADHGKPAGLMPD